MYLSLGDPADTDIRIQSIPVVVEKLQSLSAKVESVCCGSAHTLVLCSVPTKVKPCIYVMGLNSSGQLGLGKCSTVHRPAQVPFPEEVNPIGISTGAYLYIFQMRISCYVLLLLWIMNDELRAAIFSFLRIYGGRIAQSGMPSFHRPCFSQDRSGKIAHCQSAIWAVQ